MCAWGERTRLRLCLGNWVVGVVGGVVMCHVSPSRWRLKPALKPPKVSTGRDVSSCSLWGALQSRTCADSPLYTPCTRRTSTPGRFPVWPRLRGGGAHSLGPWRELLRDLGVPCHGHGAVLQEE